jgi:hypothetical protein
LNYFRAFGCIDFTQLRVPLTRVGPVHLSAELPMAFIEAKESAFAVEVKPTDARIQHAFRRSCGGLICDCVISAVWRWYNHLLAVD